jgi:hypothetical protein
MSVSLHVRYAPRHRCAHPVHLPVVACQVLVAPAVCSPRQLSGHGAQSTRRADGVLARLTVRLLWAIRSARHRSACPIATCHPLTTRAVCSPRYLSGRRVPSALHAGSVLVLPATFRSLRTLPVVFTHRQLSGRPIRSARGAGGVPAQLTVRSLSRRCSRLFSFTVATSHPLTVPSFRYSGTPLATLPFFRSPRSHSLATYHRLNTSHLFAVLYCSSPSTIRSPCPSLAQLPSARWNLASCVTLYK